MEEETEREYKQYSKMMYGTELYFRTHLFVKLNKRVKCSRVP